MRGWRSAGEFTNMSGKEIQRSSKYQVFRVGSNACLFSLTGNSDIGDARVGVNSLGRTSPGKMMAGCSVTGHKRELGDPGEGQGRTGKDKCSVLIRVLASIVAT
jgi:hypothetical protein